MPVIDDFRIDIVVDGRPSSAMTNERPMRLPISALWRVTRPGHHGSTSNALMKKSRAPKLPDFSASSSGVAPPSA